MIYCLLSSIYLKEGWLRKPYVLVVGWKRRIQFMPFGVAQRQRMCGVGLIPASKSVHGRVRILCSSWNLSSNVSTWIGLR
jgi:hypothetical protein